MSSSLAAGVVQCTDSFTLATMSPSLFHSTVFSEVFSSKLVDALVSVGVGSGSSGAGGGVVTIVHPIQGNITSTAATARNAVICRTTVA